MTVLQRRDAKGFEAGSFRKFVVGTALAAVGVAAALGLSQLIDQEAASVETGLTAVERNAIAAAQAERAESIHPVDRMLIERYRPSLSPAAIEQARGQAMVDHYTNQWNAGGGESQAGPR